MLTKACRGAAEFRVCQRLAHRAGGDDPEAGGDIPNGVCLTVLVPAHAWLGSASCCLLSMEHRRSQGHHSKGRDLQACSRGMQGLPDTGWHAACYTFMLVCAALYTAYAPCSTEHAGSRPAPASRLPDGRRRTSPNQRGGAGLHTASPPPARLSRQVQAVC